MVKSQEYPVITKKHLALIAPLDWGLGHTTRCIPIIRELQKNNFEIIIACDSRQKAILITEFPKATYTFLAGYGLSYGRSRATTLAKLFLQIPKILIAIKRENIQLKRIISQFSINIIISDNRYGIFSSGVHSILITHQLNLSTGAGKWADWLSNRFLSRLVSRFHTCWVPDFPPGAGVFTLAGKLSSPERFSALPVAYLGPLSRFSSCSNNTTEDYVLAVLSGPEPQRSILESKVLTQLEKLKRRAIVVRGVPDAGGQRGRRGNIDVLDFAGSAELNVLICNAALVVCRAGYTSIMDLAKLRKKAVLIPTPGQAEQEYLAAYLAATGMVVTADQSTLDLESAITAAENLEVPEMLPMEMYVDEVRKLADGFAARAGNL